MPWQLHGDGKGKLMTAVKLGGKGKVTEACGLGAAVATTCPRRFNTGIISTCGWIIASWCVDAKTGAEQWNERGEE